VSRAHVSVLVAAALSLAVSCGPAVEPGAPRIFDLTFDGQAPENALVLLFSLRFEDDEGDLAGGTLTPLINGHDTGEAALDLTNLLLRSRNAIDSTEGSLYFELEVEMDLDPARRPEPDSTFTVGVEIVDAAGHMGNRPSVTLRIQY